MAAKIVWNFRNNWTLIQAGQEPKLSLQNPVNQPNQLIASTSSGFPESIHMERQGIQEQSHAATY